jgi:hypothetical protein
MCACARAPVLACARDTIRFSTSAFVVSRSADPADSIVSRLSATNKHTNKHTNKQATQHMKKQTHTMPIARGRVERRAASWPAASVAVQHSAARPREVEVGERRVRERHDVLQHSFHTQTPAGRASGSRVRQEDASETSHECACGHVRRRGRGLMYVYIYIYTHIYIYIHRSAYSHGEA